MSFWRSRRRPIPISPRSWRSGRPPQVCRVSSPATHQRRTRTDMTKALSIAVILMVAVGTALGLTGGCSSGSQPIGVHLRVDLVVERCPLVTSWKASPLQASAPNGAINVAVTAAVGASNASDGIDAGANALEYMWGATAGAFTAAGEPSTVYR